MQRFAGLLLLFFAILIIFFPQRQVFAAGNEELVVKFKQNQSPADLKMQIAIKQAKYPKNPIGAAHQILDDIVTRLHGIPLPEDKLNDIDNLEKRLKIRESKELFRTTNKIAKRLGLPNFHSIKTDGTISLETIAQQYKNLPEVESVEQNVAVSKRFVPNDPDYSFQWSLQKMHLPNAWDIATGSSQLIIGVVDTGIDYNHVDMPNIIKGYNVIADSMDPMDDNGHGTHVAGLIGAATNNGVGVSGVNIHPNIMAVKVLDNNGSGTALGAAIGIYYAALNGAKVINLSLGGSGSCPDFLQAIIDYAYDNGALVVGATGEGSPAVNVDITPDFPSSCNHIISVAASEQNDQRASYSYYGSTLDIAAPGGSGCSSASCSALSTLPGNSYGLANGTSMATAHVSGVAGLIFSRNLTLTPDQVKALIKNNADTISTDFPIGKRINAYRSLLATPLRTPTPTAVVSTNSATINWSIPEATTSSKLDYGWSTSYGQTTGTTDTSPRVLDHSLSINGFAPCESFHYQVTSTDFWGVTTSSVDSHFTTHGCGVDASVIDLITAPIASTSGGSTSLLSGGTGLTLTVPANSASDDANFQINQLNKTEAIGITSNPSGLTLVGNYIYELKAFKDQTSSISAFLNPLPIAITYGSSDVSNIKDTTLAIYTWDGTSWSLLPGCSTNNSTKTVSCTTTHFSTFGLFGEAIPSSNAVLGISTSCTDSAPSNAPNLFQIDSDSGHAKLYFSPVTNNLTYYFISYGYTATDMRFGIQYNSSASTGVQSYTINDLDPSTTYYYRVRGGNNCVTGAWSNTLKSRTTGSSSTLTTQYANGQSSTTNGSLSGDNLSGSATSPQLSSDNSTASVGARAQMKPPGAIEDTIKIGVGSALFIVLGLGLMLL